MSEASTLPGHGYDDLPGLMALMTGDEKHDLAAESTLDVLWVLYDRVLRINPAQAEAEPRDRFYLSRGHGPMAFYAILTAKGFIDLSELPRYGQFDSVLGLRAMGLTDDRVFVLTGDGELDEGSGHEAIAFAGRAGLEALHCVVVDNASASYGWPGGIETRFAAEGWSAIRVSGRDHDALEAALTAPHPGRPHAVIAVV